LEVRKQWGFCKRNRLGARAGDVNLSRVTSSGALICAQTSESIWTLMPREYAEEITKPVKSKERRNLSSIWGTAAIRMTVSSD